MSNDVDAIWHEIIKLPTFKIGPVGSDCSLRLCPDGGLLLRKQVVDIIQSFYIKQGHRPDGNTSDRIVLKECLGGCYD